MRKGFWFILLVLILGSCIPSKEISFDRLSPAEITLPAESQKLLVFNHAYKPRADATGHNVISLLEEREAFIVDTIIINNIFDGFFSVAANSQVPALSNSVYYEQRVSDTTAFLKPLATSDIAFLCDEFDTDLVLALEYYSMRHFLEYDYVQSDEDGYIFKGLGEFVAIRGVERKLLWRIYHPLEGMIKEELQSDTLYWSATAVSRTRAREKLVDLLDAVKETFWFAGEEMAFMISPDWERTDRLYFDINDGYEDMSFETEYLIDQVKNASTLRKYKSLFNLAIIHERRGEPEKAIGFLNAALEIRPNSSLAKLYLEELKKYVAELKVVKQQVGEE